MAVELGMGVFAPISGVDHRTIRQCIWHLCDVPLVFVGILGTIDDFKQIFVI